MAEGLEGLQGPQVAENAEDSDDVTDTRELLALYEQMALIRRTEKAAHDLFLSGLVKGTTHLAAGHEAIAVGARVERTVAEAVEAARNAPGPDPAEALTDVWADGGAAWRT